MGDIEDSVFIGYTNRPDIDVNETFESREMKIFNDVAFVNHKQQMLVKTMEEKVDKLTQKVFNLKTLRLYNSCNRLIDEILTE